MGPVFTTEDEHANRSASRVPDRSLSPSLRSNASDLGEAPARIALRCYITKKVMSPVIPGFSLSCRILARVRPGRPCVSHRFSGSRHASCSLESGAPGRLCDRRALPRRRARRGPGESALLRPCRRRHSAVRARARRWPATAASRLLTGRSRTYAGTSTRPGCRPTRTRGRFQVLFDETIRAHRAQARESEGGYTASLRGRALPGLPHDAPAGNRAGGDRLAERRRRGLRVVPRRFRALARAAHHVGLESKRPSREGRRGVSGTPRT